MATFITGSGRTWDLNRPAFLKDVSAKTPEEVKLTGNYMDQPRINFSGRVDESDIEALVEVIINIGGTLTKAYVFEGTLYQNTDWDNTPIDCAGGFTRNQLKEAFEKVQNPDNWKLATRPVYVDTEAEALVIKEAIMFFTGGVPVITQAVQNFGLKFLVHGTKGYYHFIGA